MRTGDALSVEESRDWTPVIVDRCEAKSDRVAYACLRKRARTNAGSVSLRVRRGETGAGSQTHSRMSSVIRCDESIVPRSFSSASAVELRAVL